MQQIDNKPENDGKLKNDLIHLQYFERQHWLYFLEE